MPPGPHSVLRGRAGPRAWMPNPAPLEKCVTCPQGTPPNPGGPGSFHSGHVGGAGASPGWTPRDHVCAGSRRSRLGYTRKETGVTSPSGSLAHTGQPTLGLTAPFHGDRSKSPASSGFHGPALPARVISWNLGTWSAGRPVLGSKITADRDRSHDIKTRSWEERL